MRRAALNPSVRTIDSVELDSLHWAQDARRLQLHIDCSLLQSTKPGVMMKAIVFLITLLATASAFAGGTRTIQSVKLLGNTNHPINVGDYPNFQISTMGIIGSACYFQWALIDESKNLIANADGIWVDRPVVELRLNPVNQKGRYKIKVSGDGYYQGIENVCVGQAEFAFDAIVPGESPASTAGKPVSLDAGVPSASKQEADNFPTITGMKLIAENARPIGSTVVGKVLGSGKCMYQINYGDGKSADRIDILPANIDHAYPANIGSNAKFVVNVVGAQGKCLGSSRGELTISAATQASAPAKASPADLAKPNLNVPKPR
jgi:hypothetical protein